MVSERIKILAIDDKQDNLISLKALISEAFPEADIHMALNGREGYELATAENPDLILLDIVMPDMDGFEVCRKLKADEGLSDIPVVFVTALKGDRESRIQALECGAEAFLAKPIDEIELIAQIRAMMKIRTANLKKRTEKSHLAALVAEQTAELEKTHIATLNLLEDLRNEIEVRKIKEGELRKSEEIANREQDLSKTIIESIPGAFYVLDENGRYVRWNNYQRDEIIGKPEDQIADTNAAETIHQDDRTFIENSIANVLTNGTEEKVEGRVLLRGGPDYRWLLMTGRRAIVDGKTLLVGVGIDITERKLADTYKDISREVLTIMNEQGDLKDAIPKAIASLKAGTGFDAVGIRLQEGVDYPYFTEEGFPKELLLKENSLLERNIDGGICRDKNGNVCLECTCGLVITGKSEPGHPFFTAGGSFWTNDSFPLLELPLDVDPRLNPRNECIHHNYASVALIPIRVEKNIVGLIQFNDHRKDRFTLNSVELLEGVAGHIGAALMRKRNEDEKHILESQLHQAQKMESVGRLAGGVAHDFNNLLTVILGGAHLALSELEPGQPLHEYVTQIQKAGEKSAELTQQLLAFARKQTIEPKVLDLNDTVSGMLKMLQRLIGENTQLAWLPSNNLWAVKADPSQIDQILANLCVNARDSIADIGAITIKTGNIVVDEGYLAEHVDVITGEYVHISVSDNGCGMDKETLAHIFEPFFTTKGPGEGTGLGLATVYGAAKQNNGFVNVYSEPGIGTTFTIYLPRYVGNTEQKSAKGQAQPSPRGLETILLVEDEAAILNMVTMLLQKQGYTVLAANTPGEATSLASKHSGKIDLLITDVIMPEMNGKDLAHNLMSLNPKLNCLFMSGYTADAISQHGVLEEGVHFIHKPFSLPDLAVKVRKVLDCD